MAYDLEPLRSYVRFYLTVVKQLEKAQATLARTHETMQDRLRPFQQPLAELDNKALTRCFEQRKGPTPGLEALWRPEDEQDLSGLTDVYEVVGRFSFQGEDQANLNMVQRLVAHTRNEIHEQQGLLEELTRLPEQVEQAAQRLKAEEYHRASEARANQLAQFSARVDSLHQRAKQTTEAVHGVSLPSLDDVETAPDEYRAFVKKLDQVYQTCLPFLRDSLDKLYGFAGLETPDSWPDTLPVLPELPEELLTVPPSDSPELQRAEQQLEALTKERAELQRTHDELVASLRRLQAELASAQEKRGEIENKINQAKWRLLYAKQVAKVEEIKRELASLEQQRASRSYQVGELMSKAKQSEAALEALEKELAKRKFEIGELGKQLADERDNEPALFGKDDWRARVAELESQIEQLRQAYAQREAVYNQMKIDMSSLGVEINNEQSQLSTLDRWIEDAKAREQKAMADVRQLEQRFGDDQPVVPPTVAEAEEAWASAQNEMSDITEKIERIKLELRRNHEDGTRVLARQKQIQDDIQQMGNYVESAKVAATQGFQEAMRQLAERRRRAVEQHVDEVLQQLDQSLRAIDEVFVEPAKEALLKKLEPDLSAAERLESLIEPLREVTSQLSEELQPELLGEEAAMSQVQREFCDVAEQACRAAWA